MGPVASAGEPGAVSIEVGTVSGRPDAVWTEVGTIFELVSGRILRYTDEREAAKDSLPQFAVTVA